jgi:hypothetical protein
MKASVGFALLAAMSSTFLAVEPKSSSVIPKNLARQHYGVHLFLFDTTAHRFVATEASAAWLDDDISTGRPILAGRQHYLLQLSAPQFLTNFALSARALAGTVTIYTGDEPASPGDAKWLPAVKDLPLANLNHKKLPTLLNKTARYILLETNVSEPSPIYSFYLYGAKAAATETIAKRPAPVDVRTVAGDFVNNQTSFNLSSVYAGARVTFSNAASDASTWERAIDDNPASAIQIKPGSEDTGVVVTFDRSYPISRVALLSDFGAKGKADVYLLAQAPQSNRTVSVEGLKPAATLTFDGNADRASADLGETPAAAMAIRWTPETSESALSIREANAFANLSLSEYEMITDKNLADGKSVVDGKELAPIGEGQETIDLKGGAPLDPIATGPGTGFRPGGLGFPPNFRMVIPPDPRTPVSP